MDVLHGLLLFLLSELPLVACQWSLVLVLQANVRAEVFSGRRGSACGFPRLVGGVSFDPVIRQGATENLFTNGSESS